jgi:hypothetical protein
VAEDKHYPTDERGQLDAGAIEREPKPCAKRVTHGHELAVSPVTWCTHPEGHGGPCFGPVPWPLALEPIKRKPR